MTKEKIAEIEKIIASAHNVQISVPREMEWAIDYMNGLPKAMIIIKELQEENKDLKLKLKAVNTNANYHRFYS
tara:strand:- start:31 stop:249 length:219 start_codon:yes stop_codon:yes gene_type:complete